MNNPFTLISSDPIEYNSRNIKSNLMLLIVKNIQSYGWTQKDAAAKLNCTQPRISNLMSGKMDKFSIDMLLEMLFKLGYDLETRVNLREESAPLDMNVVRNKKAIAEEATA